MGTRKKELSLKKRAEVMLLRPVSSEKSKGLLEEMDIPIRGADYLDVVLAGLLKAAAGGSIPAFKELRDVLGDEDSQGIFQKLDSIMLALENAVEKEAADSA